MELITSHICKASELGLHGNMFGGKMLSLIDEAAAIYVSQLVDSPRVVTIKIDELVFKKPVKVGNLIKLYAKVIEFGNSSLSIYIEARKHNVYTGEQEIVTHTNIKFVRIDEEGKAIPISNSVKERYYERMNVYGKGLLSKEEKNNKVPTVPFPNVDNELTINPSPLPNRRNPKDGMPWHERITDPKEGIPVWKTEPMPPIRPTMVDPPMVSPTMVNPTPKTGDNPDSFKSRIIGDSHMVDLNGGLRSSIDNPNYKSITMSHPNMVGVKPLYGSEDQSVLSELGIMVGDADGGNVSISNEAYRKSLERTKDGSFGISFHVNGSLDHEQQKINNSLLVEHINNLRGKSEDMFKLGYEFSVYVSNPNTKSWNGPFKCKDLLDVQEEVQKEMDFLHNGIKAGYFGIIQDRMNSRGLKTIIHLLGVGVIVQYHQKNDDVSQIEMEPIIGNYNVTKNKDKLNNLLKDLTTPMIKVVKNPIE